MERTCKHKAQHSRPPAAESLPERRKHEPWPPPFCRHPLGLSPSSLPTSTLVHLISRGHGLLRSKRHCTGHEIYTNHIHIVLNNTFQQQHNIFKVALQVYLRHSRERGRPEVPAHGCDAHGWLVHRDCDTGNPVSWCAQPSAPWTADAR